MKVERSRIKKNSIYLIVIGVLVIIDATIFLLLTPFGKMKDENILNEIGLDENQTDFLEKEVLYTRNIIMPGWKEIIIDADTTNIVLGIDFYNPNGNLWYECEKCHHELDENYKCKNDKCNEQYSVDTAKTNCFYMSFALYLNENDECLYQSKLVEPNKHIQQICLNRAIQQGEYDAYVFIQPYMSDMKTPLNNGRVGIKLIVQ